MILADVSAGGGLMAVLRHDDPGVVVGAAAACITNGLDVIELTATTAGVAELTAAVVATHPGAVVGVGTVRDAATAGAVIAAGARFLVSPDFVPAVAAVAADHGVTYIPGAFTANEVGRAIDAGFGVVKLFPAAVLGRHGLAAFADVFPDVAFVVTGGIAPADAGSWLAAGAAAVGLGGALVRAFCAGADHLATAIAAARGGRPAASMPVPLSSQEIR